MDNEQMWAPYGPPATYLLVVRHLRQRDIPESLSSTYLRQIGVADGLVNRTWAALKFTGLIEEDGRTTPAFRALRYATEDEYQEVFRGILEKAYDRIFAVIGDPATATEAQLRNAFTPYSPGAQRSRMITFFLGLCREAGIDVAVPSKASATRAERPRERRTSGKPTTMALTYPVNSPWLPKAPQVRAATGLVFGVTDADIAKLDDQEFAEVWTALGKVARARARGARSSVELPADTEEGGSAESE